jgi:hypothetical protein
VKDAHTGAEEHKEVHEPAGDEKAARSTCYLECVDGAVSGDSLESFDDLLISGVQAPSEAKQDHGGQRRGL